MKKKLIFYFLFSASLLTNILLVYRSIQLASPTQPKNPEPTPIKYRYVHPIAPIIDSNIDKSELILHYDSLKQDLDMLLANTGTTHQVGIFVQSLHTGSWLGINEKEGFTPASLLKVPIAMAILKKVDRREVGLTNKLTLIDSDLDLASGQLYQKGAGSELTVWEAIKILILTSDNTAKNVLKRQLSDAEINAVYAHVGIPNPYLPKNGYLVSPRGYSRIFKALHFSTFLTAVSSEKILDLATDTQMESLISAGLPPEIQVSHKYGERPDGISDCGIVFEPSNPYLICIMTKDIELPTAEKLIQDISALVYTFIHSKQTP